MFFLCLSGAFFGALAGKMARAHFAICWCFFCSGSFLNCVFLCFAGASFGALAGAPFHINLINLIACSSVLTHLVLFLVLIL